jgi:hypothetical protein
MGVPLIGVPLIGVPLIGVPLTRMHAQRPECMEKCPFMYV